MNVSRSVVARATATSVHGVTVTPRLPDLEFLESTPRLWFGGMVGPTALYNVFSVAATELEGFFIRDAKALTPRIKNPVLLEEMRNFVRQEANHALVHSSYNKLLESRGYPVAGVRRDIQRLLGRLERKSNTQIRSAIVVTGEHILAELGVPIIENPDMMASADPVVRHLFEWHLYEEQEHKGVMMDAYNEVYGRNWRAYAVRMRAVPTALVFLYRVLVPSVRAFMLADLDDPRELRTESLKLFNWMFREPGYFRTFGRRFLALTRPDFQPWSYSDNSGDLAQLHQRVIPPHWESASLRD